MILGHMGETQTDGIPVKFIICSISISAHGCYNFIVKGGIYQIILYSQMCIRKCNISALIFLRAQGRVLLKVVKIIVDVDVNVEFTSEFTCA